MTETPRKQSEKAFFKKYQREIEEVEREEKQADEGAGRHHPSPEAKGSRSPEQADEADRSRPTTPARPSNLGSVPTSLEKIFSGTSDERNVHEVLGVLVEAHIREAESIIGRTYLKPEDVRTISNSMQLARYGIGAEGMNAPNPWISEWVLTYCRALPSIDGRSRTQFVDAWQNAQERLRHEQDQREKRQLTGV